MVFQGREGPLPQALLATPEMRRACAERDIGAIFGLARDQAGVSLSRLARLCEMTPSRVGEYIKGRTQVRQQRVVERVADGLRIPGELLGLAPRPWEDEGPEPEGDPIGAAPGLRARLADSVVELDLGIEVDVDADGWANVLYRHTVLNLTDRPLTRFSRELWFEHGEGPLSIRPVSAGEHKVTIERIHDAGTLAKFACRVSPPVPPMGSATFAYRSEGGRFTDAHYWRQAITRYTLRMRLDVRQHAALGIRDYHAIEEYPDGAKQAIDEHVRWAMDDGTAALTVTREDLRPNQFVTLYWDVESAVDRARVAPNPARHAAATEDDGCGGA
ncbi:helix-turn-helix domain-containing protein [Yinghuangia seranimata]|uniref:helix-turn-helix domain-containing protein n=1 Tax=Yinghuangia seranimata TaxID=408067 RepID=UPI00248ADA4E|nr:helix-turn-helix transcriptional regulator [Yinghuangia seranimata]MDI2132064.1 helix-turn-helix transcriptional regulator [Yinghuangia seranimata]